MAVCPSCSMTRMMPFAFKFPVYNDCYNMEHRVLVSLKEPPADEKITIIVFCPTARLSLQTQQFSNLTSSQPYFSYLHTVHSFIIISTSDIQLAVLAQMLSCLPLVQQVRGSIPGGVTNFHLKIFNLGARRGGDVHFLIARLYITVLD